MSDNSSNHRRTLWKALALLAALAIGAWTLIDRPATADDPRDSPPKSGDDEVLATVGDDPITVADVEALMEQQMQEIERQRQSLLEQGLDQLIQQRLVEKEAAERGVTPDELISTEMETKVQEVADEEVDAFYRENRDRINVPQEQVSDQIRQYLARQSLQTSLREKHGVQKLIEPVRVSLDSEGHPAAGPADAPVEIVEFSDFQCPFCARMAATLDRVREHYGDQVRIVYRQFPLRQIHPQAQKAAEASLCANDQGKFWELHDAMFANASKLNVADLKTTAETLEIDMEPFNECLDSGRYGAQVQADLEAGGALGVTGTPAVFVNGRPLSAGAVPYEAVAAVIDDELERIQSRRASSGS